MGGETDQWYPDLVYDNHPVDPPATPEEGYHLSKDLADKTIEFIRDAKVIAPDKPWFTYLCPGAGHAPAPRVQGVVRHATPGGFDMGYEAYREHRAAEPEAAGHRARGHRAVTGQPVCWMSRGPNGEPWPCAGHRAAVGQRCTADEKRLFARMAEVFAGIPVLHRRPDRPRPGLSRGDRPARQHHHRRDLRQRRQRRGRPERLGQREQVLQRLHRHRRGGACGSIDELGVAADLQPLPDRVGDGVQHALQAVQALRLP